MSSDDDTETDEKGLDPRANTTLEHRRPMAVDVGYYQSVIDDPEVSDTRKRELIEVIGTIVVQFIDLGFGVHPVQLAQVRDKPDKAECEDNSNQPEKEKEPERSDA